MTQVPEILQEFQKAKSVTDQFSERWYYFLQLAYAKLPSATGLKSRTSTGDFTKFGDSTFEETLNVPSCETIANDNRLVQELGLIY